MANIYAALACSTCRHKPMQRQHNCHGDTEISELSAAIVRLLADSTKMAMSVFSELQA
jgi:hypothetical protein